MEVFFTSSHGQHSHVDMMEAIQVIEHSPVDLQGQKIIPEDHLSPWLCSWEPCGTAKPKHLQELQSGGSPTSRMVQI